MIIVFKMIDEADFTGVIGKGAYGEIYLSDKLDKGVVVKKISKDKVERLSSSSKISIEDILEGLEHIRRLKSPYLLNIYDLIDTKDSVFIKMERLKGQLFSIPEDDNTYRYRYYRNDKIKMQHFFEILIGLAHIHNSGYAHLDVTPENIMEDFNGIAKIIDHDTVTKVNDPRFYQKSTGPLSSPPEFA